MGEENQLKLIVKYSLENSQEKFGEVLEQSNTMIKCRVLLKPDDIKGNFNIGGRHVYCGDRELYRTQKIIEIPVRQVKSTYPLCTLEDYRNSKGFLLRQTYDEQDKKFFPELTKICLCMESLNPEMSFFTCSSCHMTFHNTCVGNACPDCKLPLKRQLSEPSDLDSPTKVPKLSRNNSNSLPLDVERYKNLSLTSKNNLLDQVKSLHVNFMAMQNSLSSEDKTRQQIIIKIKCALLLAVEEIRCSERFDISMQTIETISISIEAAIYFSKGRKTSSPEYSKKIRTLIFNLLAEKNSDFRGSIVRGLIDPKVICTMETKDMASSEIKNFRQERQKVYTKEQLILPESSDKLMIKTHKGEAVFEKNDKHISDEFTMDILDSLNKKKEIEVDDDPFNPNNYESIEPQGIEMVDTHLHEIVKEWTSNAVLGKIKERIIQHLLPSQSSRILSRINRFSLNKSS
ncbi:hypothetical protein SteCoe_23816 [Stentor coeruleus]|uniref:TFIIS central domain-containing protein n=1 Tax=Stentor coeruleus TaxID=5963 RepID=A0A1R2BJ54_9CILI|nr:hypothetical protein SteCoe_23816 [Stentor coeruleus]